MPKAVDKQARNGDPMNVPHRAWLQPVQEVGGAPRVRGGDEGRVCRFSARRAMTRYKRHGRRAVPV